MWKRAAILGALAAACGDPEPQPAPAAPAADPQPHERELAALRAVEDHRRAETDFAALPPADAVLGPDPYRIVARYDGTRVGLLRGESAVVLLGADGGELQRAPAPRSPSGLAQSATGDILVVGDGARELAQFRVDGDRLERVASLDVGALGMRDVALSPDGKTAYVVEEREGRLLAIALVHDRMLRVGGIRELGRCHGPIRVVAVAGYVATDCLLDHAIEIRRDTGELVRIHHDGPMWSLALLREADGGVIIAAGGIEDHPLVREDGGFGYIDSFLYVYRLAPGAAEATRLHAINTSELGAVTPKWVDLRAARGGVVATTAGYGSSTLLALTWKRDLATPPEVTRAELPPGTAAADLAGDGTLIAANPLLDAWVVARGRDWHVVPIASARPPRPMPSRVGEMLMFTTMMAPFNSSEGKLSRFTCEACHFEGFVDGRSHFTGRTNGADKVHATSRPLYGLFNNRPHFSRALDKTTSQMVHAEFRVANRHNGRDPWFALSRAEMPWLAQLGAPDPLAPEFLREALLSFLVDFTPRTNPAAVDHSQFTELERTGARAFRDRCATCHAARLIADDGASEVPFDRWEQLVLSANGPIVWSNATYAKTGVTPYVHDSGARVSALRRLYKKWPYFTNGSAKSLVELLDRFGTGGFHDNAPADAARLSPDDKTALLAFLDLL